MAKYTFRHPETSDVFTIDLPMAEVGAFADVVAVSGWHRVYDTPAMHSSISYDDAMEESVAIAADNDRRAASASADAMRDIYEAAKEEGYA